MEIAAAPRGRRAALRGLLASCLALLAACATPAPPAVVAENGDSLWLRVESEHFTVESNLGNERRVRDIAAEFETLWAAFAAVPVLGLEPPAEKPLVVVLQAKSEYRYLAGEQSAGLFMQGTFLGPLILLPPSGGAFRETVIKHELAHYMASDFLPHDAPLWLAEGLAQLMETATYDEREGEVLFGDFSWGRVHGAGLDMPASKVMRPWPRRRSARENHEYYGRSWLIVHYLVDYHLQEFLDFLVRVSHGEDWQQAWDQELSVSRKFLDKELDDYHARAKYGLWKSRVRRPDSDTYAVSTVSPSDAYALRSFLHAYAVNPALTQDKKTADADADLGTAWELDKAGERMKALSAALEAERARRGLDDEEPEDAGAH